MAAPSQKNFVSGVDAGALRGMISPLKYHLKSRQWRGQALHKDEPGAPVDTGKYKKSWSVKNVHEDSDSIDLVVHSRNRYQIAHLLEHGHVKRGGGRVPAQPHIAAAEQRGNEKLVETIEQKLKGG